MASSKKPCLFAPLLLFLLLVSTVHGHGLQPADARDAAAASGDGGRRVTVRTSGHGHGYSSSHSGGHTSGGTAAEQGGAGVVDPRNLNARSHLRSGAAGRAAVGGYSFVVICGLVQVILAVFS